MQTKLRGGVQFQQKKKGILKKKILTYLDQPIWSALLNMFLQIEFLEVGEGQMVYRSAMKKKESVHD